jgi:hypothetical protein
MGLYVSKNIGGGFRVGTRIGGGRRRKKDEGGCISAVLLLVTIGLIFTYPRAAILSGIAIVVVMFLYFWADAGSKERKAKIADIQTLSNKLQKHLEMVNNGKTIPARINNCDKAIEILEEIQALDPDQKLTQHNSESLISDLLSVKKTIPVEKLLEKASKAQFKGSQKLEQNALVDALYHCKTEGLADRDFSRAETVDPDTGKIVTIATIENRARSLGWEG